MTSISASTSLEYLTFLIGKEVEFDHFEARDYDSVIGRWMNVDPARQFACPYVWMGNNPFM